jgi:hypothetical protein
VLSKAQRHQLRFAPAEMMSPNRDWQLGTQARRAGIASMRKLL